ncbi:MAG: molybdenum cofactor guanylyltransferase [Gammaproteobacteria bacterium]|nr:molybdenum cofactor guanylyltransferase [Gammaproteobacteria bacterium]
MVTKTATPEATTAIVLCGGSGSRLDGQDKPLMMLDEKRLVDWICERLAPQVSEIVISCSRNVGIYESLHHPLAIDKELNLGPLAGLTESFAHVNTEWAFTTPGDTPFIAKDIVSQLRTDAETRGIAVPTVNGVRQNLCLLIDAEHREQLVEFHLRGGNAVKYWLDEIGVQATDLSAIEDSFLNVNTHEDLATARSMVASD